ncbi:MAG TPA: CAP domain-containing protein [Clostridiaceae bacterium]|nr:CAP domain-containing protein [Clostridiaceae bacterium]
MKVIHIKKKKLLLFNSIFLTFIITFCMFSTSFGMQHYYKLDFQTGLVTATKLNVRSGPGTGYGIVTTVNKNQYIRVFAGVGDWYIVQVEGDYVGAVNKKYIKPIYPSKTNTGTNTNTNTNTGTNQTTTSNLSADEQEVFNLINNQRTQNGLSALKIDSEVQKVARIKAQDMVNNNYFSHTSPTYGSPFDMLKSYKVSYNTAGENIAGNSSNSGAVNAWMNSSGHRANILNKSFNYTGIGVVNSPKYGKVYVQMFIGK